MVEHLTGLPFHEYVTEHVFQAGGMVDSGYFATDQLPERTALGYIEDAPDAKWRTNIFAVPIIGGGDGGAYVTAADVSAFWTSLRSNTLLPAAITQTMLTPHMQDHESSYYGYGIWMTVDSNGTPFKYVLSGGDPGVTFYTSCFPERDIQIIAIGNTSGGAGAIGKALEQLLDLRP